MDEANSLNKQMDALIALRIKVENPATSRDDIPLTEINQGKRTTKNQNEQEDPLRVLDGVKINNTLESPRSTLKGVFKDSKHHELSFNKDEQKEAEQRLKHVYIEFYQKLRVLQHYRFMNLSAFSRILNKYEEITSRRASRSYMNSVDDEASKSIADHLRH